MTNDIAKQFEENLTFSYYERNDATIAPNEYTSHSRGFNFLYDKYDFLPSHNNGLEGYPQLLKLLTMFQYINNYWCEIRANIPAWWVNEEKF